MKLVRAVLKYSLIFLAGWMRREHSRPKTSEEMARIELDQYCGGMDEVR